jgi:tetratricopeptide (TPR) repeat protein
MSLVFIFALAISHIRDHPASHDFSEELTMTALALKNEGNLTAAIEAARRATILNPRQDAAWVALGDIQATRGQWLEAEEAWQQALRANRNNARAWSHLGLARIRRGEMAEAEASLLRALSIRFDEEAAYNLEVLRRQSLTQ